MVLNGGLAVAALGLLGLLWTVWMRQPGRVGWPQSPTRRRGFCWAFPLFFPGLMLLGLGSAVDPARDAGTVHQVALIVSAAGFALLLLALASAFGWPNPRWMMPRWLREREDARRP